MNTCRGTHRTGFTLIDLMVVIVVLGLLLVVCVSAFGRAGTNTKSLQCLNNVRQLCNAWRMYADDNRDRILYASTGAGRASASVPVTTNPSDPNNYAWSGAHMDYSGGFVNRANWDVNWDITKRPLWPYVGRDASVYVCPEDQSSVPNTAGTMVPRVLSMAMNTYLGGFTGSDGGWSFAAAYRIFLKTTEFTSITPAKLFVFLDQRPDSINWSNFMVDMGGYSPSNPSLYQFTGDIPGFFHDGGAAFSFADGHGELHRWQDARTMPSFLPNGYTQGGSASPNNPDVAWLQDHASRPK